MENFISTHRLAKQRVLITGGTSGIGLATAMMLVRYGAKLYIIGRDQDKLDSALKQIRESKEGAEVYGMSADVSRSGDLQLLFENIDTLWGGLDMLINNAGLGFGSILKGHYSDWEYILKTNLLGYMACSHEAAKRMEKQGSGHIVHVGSMSADARDEQSSVYVASKSALQGFCESFRKEVNEKHIHATLIEPGSVATPMQKIGDEEKKYKVEQLEMLHSKDVAAAILFILCQPPRSSIVDLKIKPLMQRI